MDYLNTRQNDKCVLSSYYGDEKLIALAAVVMTELLSALVAVTLSSGSQSNFQGLLWFRSYVADGPFFHLQISAG